MTLIASNASGAGTTETKTGYITIYDSPTAACTNGLTNSGNFGFSMSNVTFNNINNTTPTTTNGYDDFSCSATTCVTEGQTYTLSIDVEVRNTGQGGAYRVFVDYNDNGDFSDAGEEVANGSVAAGSNTVTRTHNITLPTNAVESDLLRMRVIHDQVGVSNSCETLFTGSSEDYGVFISPSASISGQPVNASACAGGNASFTVTATNGITFQWQEDSGSGFANISNGGIYSGATSATLSLTAVTSGMNSNTYRCIITNGCDQTLTSNNATLTITSGLSISTHPSDQTGCAGDTESFSVTAASATTFQWQEDQGSGFVNITNGGIYSGATSATLTLTGITAGMNGFDYRCNVSDGSCNGTSNAANLTVNTAPTFSAQPTTASDCAGNNVTFSVTASGGTLQWQEDQGSGFVNLNNGGVYSGVTGTTLSLSGITSGMNGFTYRCVATSGSCSGNSNSASLTVSAALGISTQPSAQSGCDGDTENFTISSPSATTFQWQEDQGSGFVNITNGGIYSGATSATLTLTGITALMNSFDYRCSVSDGSCSNTSTPVALSVNSAPTITLQPINDADCDGNNASFSVTTSGGTFQWQEDSGSGFANISNGGIYSGATTSTLVLTGITAPVDGNSYRCVATSGACSVNSNAATLTITAGPAITTQPTAQNGCVGDTEIFTVAATGATGFQWQENAGAGYLDISEGGVFNGTNSSTLTLTGINIGLNNYPYRCIVTNASGCSTISTGGLLTVTTLPSVTSQPTAQIGCAGDTETFSVSAASGTLQWQEDQGSGFNNLTNAGIYSGVTGNNLTITGTTAAMNGYTYRCLVTDAGCSINSNTEALTVNEVIITTQPSSASVCTGSNTSFSIATTGAITFTWQEDSGAGFVNLSDGGIYSGTGTNTLSLTGVIAGMNGFSYRCIARNGACNTTSNGAILTTGSTAVITTNIPSATESCDGTDFSLSLSVTTDGPTTFQWFEFDGSTSTALTNSGIYSGVTTNTLTFTNPAGISGLEYFCTLTDLCGSADSDTSTVSLLQITGQPSNQADISGNTVTFTSTSLNESCGTFWEINDGSGWVTLNPDAIAYPSGVSGTSLDVVATVGLDANWYRRVACGSACSMRSDSVQLSLIATSDVRGNMYEFDGVDDYIELVSTPLGASNTQDISYSYEAWIYADDITTRQSILGNHNYSGSSGTGLDILGGNVRFFKEEAASIVSGSINISEWHHIAATYDAVSDELRLYIDGVLSGTATSSVADGGGTHNIGTHSGDASVALSDFYNGKMDEVRIWNDVRTQTEIRENMHLSLTGNESGLALYYQFDRDKATGRNLGVRDALGINHSTAQLASASYMASQVHVGGGVSNSQTITSSGNVVFTGTNLEIDFPTADPNGEIVVSHVITENAYSPPANAPFETGYWIVNNFGTLNSGLNATPLFRYADGSVLTTITSQVTLHKRPSRDIGVWPQAFNPAASVDNTAGNNHCSFSGINSFSILVPVNNTILLGNQINRFDAVPTQDGEVQLSWEIDNEQNNTGFDIERSNDGINWENIGYVTSINSPVVYTYNDAEPISGQNYYRIKITDNNNQIGYSQIQVVEFFREAGFWVYPNPNRGVFTIEFDAASKDYSVEVFDVVGRSVLNEILAGNKNNVDISRQASGVYTLKLKVDGQTLYSRIVVSK